MKKSFVGPAVLLIVFFALLAFVLIRERIAPQEEELEEGIVEVMAFDPASVASVVFAYDDKTVEVMRDGEEWKMVQPEEHLARSEKMNDLVTQLSAVTSTEAPLEDVEDLGAFGLDSPSVIVTIRFSEEEERQLLLGDRDFTGTSAYAMASGDDRTHIVSSGLIMTMKVDPEGLKKDETTEPVNE